MAQFNPLKKIPNSCAWKQGDHLVLFGELFQRGYANGLVEHAQKVGMDIIKGTVGRREKNVLRVLNQDELNQVNGELINVPLEAGFDVEPNSEGVSPVEYIKDIKLSDWEKTQLNWSGIEESRKKGEERFKTYVRQYVQELEKKIQPGKNVLFAHLMAGGVPRAKIIMPLMNRVFKGTNDRYLASKTFWDSDLGKLCQISFLEVTAHTFRHLIELTKNLREKVIKSGGHVSYLAYGYHGTEVLINNELQWQTYTPYLQGWAKIELEKISTEFSAQNISSCVYNCPEILTNSSSIFQGVEVSLYPLLKMLQKHSSPKNTDILNRCQKLLNTDVSFDKINDILNSYFASPQIKDHCQFDKWPQHSNQNQLETMLKYSDTLIDLHTNPKELITHLLSEVVFDSCGYVMLRDSWKPSHPYAWIGHDLVAQAQNEIG